MGNSSSFSRKCRALSLVALLIVVIAGCARDGGITEGPTDKEHFAVACLPMKHVAAQYEIEVVTVREEFRVEESDWDIRGTPAREEALPGYLRLFTQEFTLYPVGLVRQAGLRRVILCENLSCTMQRRGAVPHYRVGDLYFDVGFNADTTYLRKSIHHEFFHAIHYRHDWFRDPDERWSSLNPAGFRYGAGGKSAQHLKRTSWLTDEYPGFLNHYSTTAIEEDKAEVFANLIVEPAYVETRSARDPIIRAKVQRMKEFLNGFCPDVNERFWENSRKLTRTDE